MRNLFLVRSESESRVPSPGVVKQECADRLPDMCRQGWSDVAGSNLGFGSVQQFPVCVSPNKALEPTPGLARSSQDQWSSTLERALAHL